MTTYRSILLKDLLKDIGKEKTQVILSNFSCPMNSDIEYFLRKKAIEFERVGLARTVLIYKSRAKKSPILVAFYSTTPSFINLEFATKSQKKKILGTSYPMGNDVKAILIGQISKNFFDGSDIHISGRILMGLIFEKVVQIDIVSPSVLTYVECQDIPQLKRFYEYFGFEYLLTKRNDKTGEELLCYVIQTKKIIDAVERLKGG